MTRLLRFMLLAAAGAAATPLSAAYYPRIERVVYVGDQQDFGAQRWGVVRKPGVTVADTLRDAYVLPLQRATLPLLGQVSTPEVTRQIVVAGENAAARVDGRKYASRFRMADSTLVVWLERLSQLAQMPAQPASVPVAGYYEDRHAVSSVANGAGYTVVTLPAPPAASTRNYYPAVSAGQNPPVMEGSREFPNPLYVVERRTEDNLGGRVSALEQFLQTQWPLVVEMRDKTPSLAVVVEKYSDLNDKVDRLAQRQAGIEVLVTELRDRPAGVSAITVELSDKIEEAVALGAESRVLLSAMVPDVVRLKSTVAELVAENQALTRRLASLEKKSVTQEHGEFDDPLPVKNTPPGNGQASSGPVIETFSSQPTLPPVPAAPAVPAPPKGQIVISGSGDWW